MPLAQIIMADAAGPARMGRVMALVAVLMMLAPTLGLLTGGILDPDAQLALIFFVNIVVGAVAIPLYVLRLLPSPALDGRGPARRLRRPDADVDRTRRHHPRRACAQTQGTFNSGQRVYPGSGHAALVAASIHALCIRYPLLDLHLYRRWYFSAASISRLRLGAAVFGAMILMPFIGRRSALGA